MAPEPDHSRHLGHLPELRPTDNPMYLDGDTHEPAGSGRALDLANMQKNWLCVSGVCDTRACRCELMVGASLNPRRRTNKHNVCQVAVSASKEPAQKGQSEVHNDVEAQFP